MGVAALFGCRLIPIGSEARALHRLAEGIVEADAAGFHHGQVALLQNAVIPGIFQQGGDIGGHKVFPFAPAHDEGAFFFHGKNGLREIPEQHGQRIAAPHHAQSFVQSLQRLAVVAAVDELDEDLRVRLAFKGIALRGQFFLQDAVIFNDAVVDDAHPGGGMGVAVHIAGLAVGGPAGVPDAAETLAQALQRQLFPQLCQPPLAFDYPDAALHGQGHPGGIVPAVLQFLQTIQQHILCAALARIAYNATHTKHLHADRADGARWAHFPCQLSLSVYVLVWLSLRGSVAVLLPFFAPLCGWYSQRAPWACISRRNIRRNVR